MKVGAQVVVKLHGCEDSHEGWLITLSPDNEVAYALVPGFPDNTEYVVVGLVAPEGVVGSRTLGTRKQLEKVVEILGAFRKPSDA